MLTYSFYCFQLMIENILQPLKFLYQQFYHYLPLSRDEQILLNNQMELPQQHLAQCQQHIRFHPIQLRPYFLKEEYHFQSLHLLVIHSRKQQLRNNKFFHYQHHNLYTYVLNQYHHPNNMQHQKPEHNPQNL